MSIEGKLSPYCVRRAFCGPLLILGTPANAPKPCGRSPGRPAGRRSAPAPRHPVVKTTSAGTKRAKKNRQTPRAPAMKSA
jgi:hypothetical protein